MLNYVLIVAGGKGLRMGADIPKQFIEVGGKPLLMWTLERFHTFDASLQLLLVLPASHQDYWRSLCGKYSFTLPHQVVTGGETRFHSVKNALACVDAGAAAIAVHDGVRPFVSSAVIGNCFQQLKEHQAVVPVVEVVETVREVEEGHSHTVDRNRYRLVQTPQTFRAEVLKEAYAQPYQPSFTDDASVVESVGVEIHLVPGNRENIKITTPYDLMIAQQLVKCSI